MNQTEHTISRRFGVSLEARSGSDSQQFGAGSSFLGDTINLEDRQGSSLSVGSTPAPLASFAGVAQCESPGYGLGLRVRVPSSVICQVPVSGCKRSRTGLAMVHATRRIRVACGIVLHSPHKRVGDNLGFQVSCLKSTRLTTRKRCSKGAWFPPFSSTQSIPMHAHKTVMPGIARIPNVWRALLQVSVSQTGTNPAKFEF